MNIKDQKQRNKLEIFFSIIDPLLSIDPKVLQRTEKYADKLFYYAGYTNFFSWIIIWSLTIFLNDWNKENFYFWLNYRLVVISVMLFLLIVFHLKKEKKPVAFFCVYLLAATQSIAYAWSFSLGIPLNRYFLTLFPFLVIATSFRSVVLSQISLLSILFLGKGYWIDYLKPSWVFTDFEIAFFGFVFVGFIHKSLLDNKANSIKLQDLEVERIEQEIFFYDKLSKFVSPALIERIKTKQKEKFNISTIIDEILRRKKVKTAVVYCDWRNFTKKSDSIDFIEKELIPSTGAIIDICESAGGIARQTGDAVLTFYPDDDHEVSLLQGLKSAVESFFSEKIRNKNKRSEERFFILTYGDAIIGNMASKRHHELTIMGKPANLASRIDEITKNPEIKIKILANDCIIIDEESKKALCTFADGWEFFDINLSSIGEKIRSFDEESNLYLFNCSKKNIDLVNSLLKLNNFTQMNSRAMFL